MIDSILLQDDRLLILQALSHKLVLSDELDLREIADDTEGFTGADLQAVLYTALLKAVEQTFTPCGEFSCTDTCERSHSLTIHK
jgi:SpoVK/Ycf46/Vps4 family AAA+-type ATPase